MHIQIRSPDKADYVLAKVTTRSSVRPSPAPQQHQRRGVMSVALLSAENVAAYRLGNSSAWERLARVVRLAC